jgi:hypothetical protein
MLVLRGRLELQESERKAQLDNKALLVLEYKEAQAQLGQWAQLALERKV